MPQGTNPWYVYKLPFATDLVKKVRILFRQSDGLKIKKTEKDAMMEGNVVKVRLTQEDTFRLNEKFSVEHQIRVLTKAGDSFKSKVFKFTVDECLDREVL